MVVKVNLIQFNPNLAFIANHNMSHFGALYILGLRLCSVTERSSTWHSGEDKVSISTKRSRISCGGLKKKEKERNFRNNRYLTLSKQSISSYRSTERDICRKTQAALGTGFLTGATRSQPMNNI